MPTETQLAALRESFLTITREPKYGYVQDPQGNTVEKQSTPMTDAIMSKVQAALVETEKAYGGCHKCYGKGYATVIDSQSWHDTDTDIGSLGGRGHSDTLIMKYCSCDRGKQLAQLSNKEEQDD